MSIKHKLCLCACFFIYPVPTPAVSILAPGGVVHANSASSLSLTCSIQLDPNITHSVTVAVTWLQGRTQLFNGTDSVSISSTQPNSQLFYTSILTVDPVNSSDSDNFTCRAMVVPTSELELVTASDVNEDTVLVIIEGRDILFSHVVLTWGGVGLGLIAWWITLPLDTNHVHPLC